MITFQTCIQILHKQTLFYLSFHAKRKASILNEEIYENFQTETSLNIMFSLLNLQVALLRETLVTIMKFPHKLVINVIFLLQ